MTIHGEANAAIESLPLKLIIIVIILGITLPMIYIGLKGADRTSTENNIRSEITAIKSMVQNLCNGGVGNADVMEVDFSDGLMTNLDYIKLGDNLNGYYVSVIKYKLSGGAEKIITIEYPEVAMTGPDGETLVLLSSKYRLSFECMKSNTIDIDGDGTYNDLYILIQIIH